MELVWNFREGGLWERWSGGEVSSGDGLRTRFQRSCTVSERGGLVWVRFQGWQPQKKFYFTQGWQPQNEVLPYTGMTASKRSFTLHRDDSLKTKFYFTQGWQPQNEVLLYTGMTASKRSFTLHRDDSLKTKFYLTQAWQPQNEVLPYTGMTASKRSFTLHRDDSLKTKFKRRRCYFTQGPTLKKVTLGRDSKAMPTKNRLYYPKCYPYLKLWGCLVCSPLCVQIHFPCEDALFHVRLLLLVPSAE